MKIRTGFVSNSSSSSFIIGIAKVPKDEKVPLGLNVTPIHLNKYARFDDLPYPLEGEYNDDPDRCRIWIESFTGYRVEVICSLGDNVMWFDGCGGHTDEDFWNEYEYDYDNIYLDDFGKLSTDRYEHIQKAGGQVLYGAGRDG